MARLKTLLYIAQHLSTGGMPQFLLRQVQLLKDIYNIHLIEYDDITGGRFVVQRNQLKELLKGKFHTLGKDKNEIFNLMVVIQPDILHFNELPEYFMADSIAERLYKKNRRYLIVETSHDSSFDVYSNKKFLPDKFLMVSQTQVDKFSVLNIPCELMEYPVEDFQRPERAPALRKLGLNPAMKHVLNVGLFTPRKNQKEAFEIARQFENEPIMFHFVGNMAENFTSYWEPLLQNKPDNCVIWDERKDVPDFYAAMDLLLFTSKGTATDMETNPLVIKEALSWHMPILMYNLPTYGGMYSNNPNITFLVDNIQEDANQIRRKLNVKPNYPLRQLTYDADESKFTLIANRTIQNFAIVVKDADSGTCIYSYTTKEFSEGSDMWIVPLPKPFYDFKIKPEFGKFRIEIYEGSELIAVSYQTIKTPSIKKEMCDWSNAEPIFIGHGEFFIEDIYKEVNFKDKLMIDVGYNVGLVSKLARQRGATRIIGLEPNISVLNDARINAASDSSVTLIEKALYTSNGQLEFYVQSDNAAVSSLVKFAVAPTAEHEKSPKYLTYKVDTITFDSLLELLRIDRVGLLKMDIEGAEYDILDSFTEKQFDKIDSMLIELHSHVGKSFEDIQEYLEKFRKHGFQIKVFSGSPFVITSRFVYAEK